MGYHIRRNKHVRVLSNPKFPLQLNECETLYYSVREWNKAAKRWEVTYYECDEYGYTDREVSKQEALGGS